MAHCNSCSCVTDDVCLLNLTLAPCSCTTQQQYSNKKRKQGQETQQQNENVVVGTNWDVCDYHLPLKKRKIKTEKSDLGGDTKNDDAVWRNWEDLEYDLPIKKRKIKGRIWGYCEYDLPLKKRKINKEKSDISYNNDVSFLFSSIENKVSSSTTDDDTKFANKQETKKTCNADDEWEIKKVLENSDVCRTLSRLLLKKDLTQKFVIPVVFGGAKVAEKKGVEVQVWDVDTKSLHSLVFKIWISAKSHVFTKTWVKDFVLRRKLKKGDQIGLHWDQDNGRFNFSVISL